MARDRCGIAQPYGNQRDRRSHPHGTHGALVVVAPDRSGGFSLTRPPIYMMQHETQPQPDEPVGIVISPGWEPESTPRFSAYMWAPFPEDEVEPEVQAA